MTMTDEGADDFTIVRGCKVKSLDIPGVYLQPGTVTSVQVTIYSSSGSTPGAVVNSRLVSSTSPDFWDSNGTLHVPFSNPSLGFMPGIYWLSVQVNVASNAPRVWGWDATSA
jgi:hypothetical protein